MAAGDLPRAVSNAKVFRLPLATGRQAIPGFPWVIDDLQTYHLSPYKVMV